MDKEADGRAATAAERVRTWVREDFFVELTALEPVAHGDTAAELWRGSSDGGARYAIKWTRGGTPAGLLVSAQLAECGVPGIAGPVLGAAGLPWSEREGRRLSVLPWVSDDHSLDDRMSAERWVAFGALMARVHATALTDPLASVLPREDHTHDRVASSVHILDGRLRGLGDRPSGPGVPAVPGEPPGLGEPVDLGKPDDRTDALAREWRAAADRISTLLARADSLGQELRARNAPLVVCHGDPHLGNLLIGSGAGIWLIDWDDALLAPPERDLLFVLGGVLADAPVSPEEQAWFFDGYGPAQIDPTRLAYYRCTRALEDLAGPAEEILDVRRAESDRARALAIFRGVLSPTGLVALALSPVRDLHTPADSRDQ